MLDVRMSIGHRRPSPPYPTQPALYPVPVRRVRLLSPASFAQYLAISQLPLTNGSAHHGPQGIYAPKHRSIMHGTEKSRRRLGVHGQNLSVEKSTYGGARLTGATTNAHKTDSLKNREKSRLSLPS